MTALASRVAGRRLVLIIGILALPILLLGFLTLQGIRKDISATKDQLAGIHILEQVIPLMLEKAQRRVDSPHASRALNMVLPEINRLGLGVELKELSNNLKDTHGNGVAIVDTLTGQLHDVGIKSKLLLSDNEEIFFLSLVTTIDLPNIVADFHAFELETRAAIASGKVDVARSNMLLVRLGELSRSIKSAVDSLEHARNVGHDAIAYGEVYDLLQAMQLSQSNVVLALGEIGENVTPRDLQNLLTETVRPDKKYDMAKSMGKIIALHLNAALTTQLDGLNRKFYYLFTLAAACLLAAGVFAALMFASTFKKLDLVEIERHNAEMAHAEAEAMGRKVVAFNEDLSKLNRDLADKVSSLKQVQDELVKKGRMEQLGQLTATIAHEIRNPLGSVRTSAFLLERKIAGKGLGVEPQLERINKGVVRCDNIITQLLDFSRTKEVNSVAANLDEWLVGVVREEVQRMPENVFVECSLGLNDMQVYFDGSRLQRAVINLMSNACEAMVTAETQGTGSGKSMTISVSSFKRGDFALVRVTDNGPGISPENLAKIREPLFTTKSFGTGLGLPAVEQIAAQHGGALEITSEPGKGASFTILLPLKHKKDEAA